MAKKTVVVRMPSASRVKLNPLGRALAQERPEFKIDLRSHPVDLQDRTDLQINAQPAGRAETIHYANLREQEMCRQFGPVVDLDVSIESGDINGDAAVIVFITGGGERLEQLSETIPFLPGTIEEARKRGFKQWTAGMVAHELFNVPANDWHRLSPPYISREEQIFRAIITGLRQLKTF